MKKQSAMAMAVLAMAAPVAAQGVRTPQPAAVTVTERQAVEARASVETRITPGAPYAAEATTETVQVLADGNRIVRKTTARFYRDTEGRTRRESVSSTGELQSVTISDAVAGVSYVLQPGTKTAFRTNVLMTTPSGFTAAAAAGGRGGAVAVAPVEHPAAETAAVLKRELEAKVVAGETRVMVATPPVATATIAYPTAYPAEAVSIARTTAGAVMSGPGTANKEDLGSQVVEGIAATGTRTTLTIAAGAIGNEQPIQVVSEQWFSPELQVFVMTKHNDPRTGETTYRLTNISRAEPARSLFELPADYTLRESAIRRQSPFQPE